jgi:hypothetical protein
MSSEMSILFVSRNFPDPVLFNESHHRGQTLKKNRILEDYAQNSAGVAAPGES